MAINDEGSGGIPATMLVGPAGYGGYGNNGGFGFGGDFGAWLILALLFGGGMGWGGMGGWGGMMGGFGGMYEFPWLMAGQQNINTNTNSGFRDAMLNDGINGIRDGIAGLGSQICGLGSDMQMALANGFRDVSAQMYNNEIASLNRSFDAQQASTAGFFGVQQGISDLRYTTATEACATRNASAMNTRDIIDSQTRGTQAVLDKLCALELDQKNDTIAQLRQELLYSRGQASQVAQTAELRQANATNLNNLVSELRSCPIPAQPVYGSQPIFTCGGNNSGCGCGNY